MNSAFVYRNAFADAAVAASMTSSGSSDMVSLTGMTKKLGIAPSNIKLNLENHFKSKIFTSGSAVNGSVTITTRRDVRFDSIQIILVGTTTTRVDGINSPHVVTHTFLKMLMPIPESTYPVPRVLENGQTYTIPFNFVIPNCLTINACSHQLLAGELQDQHCRLPPSVGNWDRDDLAPQMAQVKYAVVARVHRQPDLEGRRIKIMEASQQIQVLPAAYEDAPLVPCAADSLYKLSKSKTLRKNLLAGKLGRLTARAAQPGAVFLSPDGRRATGTTAHVDLDFQPAAADVLPPKITAVSGKIVAHTFYSSGTISSFPNLAEWNKPSFDKRGSYSASVSLPSVSDSFSVSEGKAVRARWEQRMVSMVRRDSGYSSDDGPGSGSSPHSECDNEHHFNRRAAAAAVTTSSKKSKSKSKSTVSPVYHTLQLQLPVHLPVDKKIFIPTFHSCIASRVYTIQLSLTVALGATTLTLSLSLPLQLAVENGQLDAGLPSFEAAVEEALADQYLQPRLLRVPDAQYIATSALPGYEDLIAR